MPRRRVHGAGICSEMVVMVMVWLCRGTDRPWGDLSVAVETDHGRTSAENVRTASTSSSARPHHQSPAHAGQATTSCAGVVVTRLSRFGGAFGERSRLVHIRRADHPWGTSPANVMDCVCSSTERTVRTSPLLAFSDHTVSRNSRRPTATRRPCRPDTACTAPAPVDKSSSYSTLPSLAVMVRRGRIHPIRLRSVSKADGLPEHCEGGPQSLAGMPVEMHPCALGPGTVGSKPT